MIGLRTHNDVLNGVIEVYNNSILTGSYQRAFLEILELGLREELNVGSDPTLSDFLSPTLNKAVKFTVKTDQVVTVAYTLLSQISTSGLNYTLGDNIVYQTGIFNLFSDAGKIYMDKLYTIDKSKSTPNSLWLTDTIEKQSGSIYKALYTTKCITVIYNIPKLIKNLVFKFDECCGCTDSSKVTDALRYLEGIKIQEECNDCGKQRELLKRLKKILDIC